jgi:hypothetical protein
MQCRYPHVQRGDRHRVKKQKEADGQAVCLHENGL